MRDVATVLLVEDDREIRNVAALRLQAAGYRTVTAENGAVGVRLAMAEHPDAIVMDVRMPTMDGVTALIALKAQAGTRGIPVVMLSASIVDQQRALEAGARFFLSKPYQGAHFLATLTAAIQNNALSENEVTR